MVGRILGSGCYSWAERTFPPIFILYPIRPQDSLARQTYVTPAEVRMSGPKVDVLMQELRGALSRRGPEVG
jgi:hypothetical protein